MDSGNSGSMQSSSGGGDDESYDSRVETSISALLGPALHRQQHHQHHHQQQVEFDSLSNIFVDVSREMSLTASNPLLNLDMVWPTKKQLGMMRSDGQTHNLISQSFLTRSQLGVGGQVSGGGAGGGGPSNTFTHQIPNVDQPINTNSNNNNNFGGVRSTNPKKRSRASRRAPTTILTTDTTNFRAMVQEFTGIPAPPFTGSSSFPRSRLDLIGSSSSARSIPGIQNTNRIIPDLASSLPPYILSRPFPHKAPLQQNAINLQQSHSPLLNINTMQSPTSSSSSVLNFQSLFQNPHNLQKYPSPNSGNNVLASSSKPSQGSLVNLREDDQFALSHGLSMQPSTMNWVDNSKKSEGNVDLLRSINVNHQSNGKLSYAASSTPNVESNSISARNEVKVYRIGNHEEEEEDDES